MVRLDSVHQSTEQRLYELGTLNIEPLNGFFDKLLGCHNGLKAFLTLLILTVDQVLISHRPTRTDTDDFRVLFPAACCDEIDIIPIADTPSAPLRETLII